MTTIPKGTTFYNSNFQPGELIHMDFLFYNVTFIHGFTSMLTVVCENNGMSKLSPVHITRFVLKIIKNEQHSCKRVRVDEDGAMGKSTYFTKLLVE